MSRANWLVLGLVLLFGGSVAVARDARVFPLSPIGSGGAGGSGGCGGDCASLSANQTFTGTNNFTADGGTNGRMWNGYPIGLYGLTYDGGALLADGGGNGPLRPGVFNCWDPQNGVPCLQGNKLIEIIGAQYEATNSACAVELINGIDRSLPSADVCAFGVQTPGNGSYKGFRVTQDFSLYTAGNITLEGPGRAIRGPASQYLEFQATPAAAGVGIYLSTGGGGLASSGTMLAFYNPGYSGSNVAQVEYDGALISGSARTKGTVTLVATAGSVTTFSGAVCVCTDTTAALPVQCSVSGTTLSIVGTGTDVIAYHCL